MREVLWLGAAMRGDLEACRILHPSLTASDWKHVAHLAEYHQLAPLLWSTLRDQTLPNALEWRRAYYETALLNERRIDALGAVLDQLRQWGIRPIFLKGAALLADTYTFGERRMADVDLLVARESIRTAWAIFSAAGFILEPASRRYWRLMKRNTGEIRLIHHQTGAFVELHWWLYAGAWSHIAGLLTVWPATQPAYLGTREILIPSQEEMLLHLVHHAVVSNQLGEGVGRMLVDIERVSRRDVDWAKVAALARQRNLRRAVWLAFHIIQQWLGVATPPHIERLITPIHQRLLTKLVPWNLIAGGTDLRQRRGWRVLVLVALQPRIQDQMRLVWEGLNPVYWRR